MAAIRAVLNVPDVSCNHCKMAIEGAVARLEGIDAVDVDVAGKSVAVSFDDGVVTLDAIEEAVREEGYEVAGEHVFDV